MKRLTAKNEQGNYYILEDLNCSGPLDAQAKDLIFLAIERLGTLEDKIESGELIKIPNNGIGNLSDGYHTFNQLYHHRAILFSVICNTYKEISWKSKKHYDGTMFDGMFIVGIDTKEGTATYHYDIEPYWELFNVKEYPSAPKWDGHTSTDALERIKSLSKERNMVAVRIQNNKTGKFRNKDGNFGKYGAAYSTMGQAKNSISQNIFNTDLFYCDFIVFSENGVQRFPVIDHMITYFLDKLTDKDGVYDTEKCKMWLGYAHKFKRQIKDKKRISKTEEG